MILPKEARSKQEYGACSCGCGLLFHKGAFIGHIYGPDMIDKVDPVPTKERQQELIKIVLSALNKAKESE
jgi:hypothetical protein